MGLFSVSYDHSFDGVSFWEQSSSFFHVQKNVTTEGAIQHTPGTSDNAFSQRGAGAEPFEIVVAVDQAEYQSLLNKRGDVGTLSYSGGTPTVKLLDVLDRPGRVDTQQSYIIGLRFQP